MSASRRPFLSPRALVRELLFIVRMRTSQRRFRRHDMAWRRHQAAGNRHLAAMAAEVEFRAVLCERNAAARVGAMPLRTASAVPVAGSRWRLERDVPGAS